METTSRRISHSQYTMWSKCPHQWKLKYVDDIRVPDNNINSIFGTAMHDTIQGWLKYLYDSTTESGVEEDMFTVSGLQKTLLTRMRELITQYTIVGDDEVAVLPCTHAEAAEYYAQGREILSQLCIYKDDMFNPEYTLVGIEYELNVPLTEQLHFTGFIDILFYDAKNETYIIVDLKTSKEGWGYWEMSDAVKLQQLLLYKQFLSTQLNVPLKHINVEYIILARKPKREIRLTSFRPKQATPYVSKSNSMFDHFLSSTFDAQGNVKLKNLPPTPSKSACKFCKYKGNPELCSVGIIA